MADNVTRTKGIVLDVNRMIHSGTMYTYVLIRIDGSNAVFIVHNSARYSPQMAFAQMGQRVQWGVNERNELVEFTILWDESPKPWEQDPRVGPPKA